MTLLRTERGPGGASDARRLGDALVRLAAGGGAAPGGPQARRIPAGAEIVSEGGEAAPAIWVLSGWLALLKTLDDGRQQIVDILMPPDLLAPRARIGTAATHGLSALTAAQVATLAPADFQAARRRSARLAAFAEAAGAAMQARQAERLLRIAQGTATERVAHALLELALRMSAVGARGAGARLPVTQAQLGAFTGLSGVHVCRTLGTLAREGAISRPGRGIVAGDLGRLAALARADIARLARDILAPPPDLAP